MGIICGLTVQGIALVTVNSCTDWNKEVIYYTSFQFQLTQFLFMFFSLTCLLEHDLEWIVTSFFSLNQEGQENDHQYLLLS